MPSSWSRRARSRRTSADTTATVVGYLTFDPAKRTIESLSLVSDGGKFDKMDMGVAVRSVR